MHLQNHALLAEIVTRHEIECGYARDGSFVIAGDEEEEGLLRRSHPLLMEDGFPCEFLKSSEVNRTLRTCGFGGGLFNPSDGRVDPVGLIRGMAAITQRDGLRIFEHTAVRHIRKVDGSWVLDTDHGSVTAPLLFLASNAWTPILLPKVMLRPVRGQCLAVGSLEELPASQPCYSNYGSEYWRGVGRSVVLGGMRRAGNSGENCLEDGITEAVHLALDRFCSDHFPYLRGVSVSLRWSGIMAYTGDGLPLVGAVPHKEGMYLAGGYTGHGFGYAFLAARWLVHLALGETDEIPELCRIDRIMRFSPALSEI
jgi:gamma-glutamylputrescine oxidase